MKSQNDESIEKIFVAKGRFYIYRLLLSIFLLFSIYYIYKLVNNSYRILFTVILVLFGINYVIQTKRALKRIRTKIKVEDILNNGKTGDIILFKSNENYDVPDFLFFKVVPTNLTNDIWSNVGILYKDEMTQQIFIWICDDKKEVDEYSNKSKTGVKKLLFLDYIKKYNGIIAYSKLNIDIDNKKFMKKVKVYSKYPFKKSFLRKSSIKSGISSNKFISDLLNDLDMPVKKAVISHPLNMLNDNYSNPEIIIE